MTITLTPSGPYPLGTTTVTLRIEDQDGLFDEADATVTVVDDTDPTISFVAPAPTGTNGWFNATTTDVTVTASATDNCSVSITTETTGAQPGGPTVTGDTAGVTIATDGTTDISFVASDGSPNSADAATGTTVMLDRILPVITPTTDPAPNEEGWNDTAVTLSFECFDVPSGVLPGSCPADLTFTEEGVHTGTVTTIDVAGNVGSLDYIVRINFTDFLVIDEDSIGKDVPPNYFSDDEDVNLHIADKGQRAQLGYFAEHAGDTITLHTGEVGDEGWFALKTIPASWDDAGPTADGLTNYVKADPETELGGEDLLDKIPDVTPLRADGLKLLEGESVCAVVYKSDISINYDPLDGSLKGDTLGIVAFKVLTVTQLNGFSSGSLPEVVIEILDADETCAKPLTLFQDAPEPTSSSEPYDVAP